MVSVSESVCFLINTHTHTPLSSPVDAIRNGIDILVGTPGRIKDHIQNHKLDLSKLNHVVLDEVDQMLDMGFAEQVEEILASSYKKGKHCRKRVVAVSVGVTWNVFLQTATPTPRLCCSRPPALRGSTTWPRNT